MTMKRKELEILLQKIPPHPSPKVELEQYSTPAGIAADIIFEAHARGDVAGKTIVDLGCGTGIFAIGASLMGALETVGIDIDKDAVALAKKSAEELGADADFRVEDVEHFSGHYDTCFQNPPFGYQNRGLDRAFLKKAIEVAGTVYTFHHADAASYVEKTVAGKGVVTGEQNYKFPMPYTYRFHTKKVKTVDVTLFRIVKVIA